MKLDALDLKKLWPTKALILLMGIGMVDLIVTAVLHSQGLIIELNPLMRPLIERSEWLFAFVKFGTLFFAWLAMVMYAQKNLRFVRNVCLYGSGAYVFVWCTWFFSAAQ